jgi:hypothetical protein
MWRLGMLLAVPIKVSIAYFFLSFALVFSPVFAPVAALADIVFAIIAGAIYCTIGAVLFCLSQMLRCSRAFKNWSILSFCPEPTRCPL